jgi:hypothetical protein
MEGIDFSLVQRRENAMCTIGFRVLDKDRLHVGMGGRIFSPAELVPTSRKRARTSLRMRTLTSWLLRWRRSDFDS